MNNWCEYVSQDGEVRNVLQDFAVTWTVGIGSTIGSTTPNQSHRLLQLFCECDDLDETFTDLVSSTSRPGPTADGNASNINRWERILVVAQDRSRIPWPGGAKRIDLAWVVSATLLCLLRWRARQSTTLLEAVLTLMVCFGGLGFSHIQALKRRSNSQFHVAWLSLSLLGSYYRYLTDVRTRIPWTADLTAHMALIVLVGCHLHCCLADPGRDHVLEDDDISTDDKNKRFAAVRAGRCSICRSTFRLRDHHCVWVGQCVAERTRRTFLAFLTLLSGLATWFGVQMALLQVEREPLCNDQRARQWRIAAVACLVRHNRGGEPVFHALYALVASVLVAAFAAQQAVLVAAGMTSVELRRSRVKRTTYDATSDIASALPYQLPDRSFDCSASWDHQQQQAGSPSTFPTQGPRRPRLFPPTSDMLLHWRRFLGGTELPAPTSPVKTAKRQ